MILTVTSIIYYNHKQTGVLLEESIKTNMNLTAQNISEQVKSFNAKMVETCVMGAELLEGQQLESMGSEWMEYAFERVNSDISLVDFYAANSSGSFIGATKEPSLLTREINRSIDSTIEVVKTRDANFNVLKSTMRNEGEIFDPRVRPWFKEGIKTEKFHITEPYYFINSKELGITYACPIKDSEKSRIGVVGLDISAKAFREILNDPSLKITTNSFIFLIHSSGIVVGHSKIEKHEAITEISQMPAWVIDSYNQYKENGREIIESTTDEQEYLSIYLPLNRNGNDGYSVGFIVPKSDFSAPLVAIKNDTLIFSAILLLLSLILLTLLARGITEPILRVCNIAQEIQQFKLEDSIEGKAYYREIAELQRSLIEMQIGLKSFQKYLPTELVRKLIKMGKEVEIGGEKRDVIILFTDIQDFTTYSEKETPDNVTKHLSEYFQNIGEVIAESGGIIDKYIGDAVMIVWNIPEEIEYPEALACHTALKMRDRINETNEKWVKSGQKPFITRIGIHCGSVIAGNIGCDYKIDYTVIGDTVNVASRLEGLNKQFGSDILISEALFDRIKEHFHVIPKGLAKLKGRDIEMNVYQLVGEKQ